MATFTQDDVDYLKSHGNDECGKTWLGLWDPKRAVHQDHRELMIDKYERKRYYLEPGSPLKSLTNAVSLKSGSTTALGTSAGAGAAVVSNTNGVSTSATASIGSSSSGYKSNGDGGHADLVHISNGFSSGHTTQHNNNKHHYRPQNTANAATERSFQLTPPSTQRTTMNGLHKGVVNGLSGGAAKTSSTAISRPQHHHHHHQQQQNGYSQSLEDAFMQKGANNINNNNNNNNNNNELNVLHMSTSRMSESSSASSVNGFGTDADFVADFGSANIFDATATTTGARSKMSSPPQLNGVGGGGVGVISSNGYARIQPLKQKQQQQQQQNQYQLLNGNSSQSESIIGNGNAENFADFEHAPIFNAAANYHFKRKNVIRRCAGGSENNSSNESSPIPSSPPPIRSSLNSQRTSRGLRGQTSPNRGSTSQPNAFEESPQSAQSVISEESADIRQATTHFESIEESIQSTAELISTHIQIPGSELMGTATTQQAVNALTCQLNAPQQLFSYTPSIAQASYSGYCPQPSCCTGLSNMSQNNNCNQVANSYPNQVQRGGYCASNIAPINWSCYANNTPSWPSSSDTNQQGNQTFAANSMHAEALTANFQNSAGVQLHQQQQQQPQTYCTPMSCPLPCLPPPCAPPVVAPLPPICGDQQQQPTATVAGLSYSPIPQQTIINTAQQRPQNGFAPGCVTASPVGLEAAPSYSTLYNRSYSQPPVCSYPNPFIQQQPCNMPPVQTPPSVAPMPPAPPTPPECYNPFHPYCNTSDCCPKSCMPCDTIPMGDPIIYSSCNMPSAYNNCCYNNWCLPIPNSNSTRTNNNQQNNGQNTNNNNNKLSSTPGEDRYAALKDLDEQLRESKAAATVVPAYGVEAFGNNTVNGNGINPFNHQQVNPFQASNHGTSPSAAQNYFGQMTVISNGNNGNGITSQQATQYYNYSNGFGNATTTTGTYPHTVMATGPNGCGFALGALQTTALTATGAGGGGAFNNPFSASGAVQTNNPFL